MRAAIAALAMVAWGDAAAWAQGGAMAVSFYHLDAQGNVLAVTDWEGNEIESHDYDIFGQEVSPQPGTQPLRFTGKERDAETGWDYFGARYYSSRVGRFTTTDPVLDQHAALVDPQRWNRYAYGRNNPLRYVDPDGKEIALAANLSKRGREVHRECPHPDCRSSEWKRGFDSSDPGSEQDRVWRRKHE